MKKIITALVLMVSAISAKAVVIKPLVDCNGAQARVTITSTLKRFSATEAAQIAYDCLKSSNRLLSSQRSADQLKSSVENTPDDLTDLRCGQTTEPLQIIILKSWNSERPSYSVNGKTASLDGNTKVLVREPISCVDIGTGLYTGITNGTVSELEISESYSLNVNDASSGKQILNIELKKVSGDLK